MTGRAWGGGGRGGSEDGDGMSEDDGGGGFGGVGGSLSILPSNGVSFPYILDRQGVRERQK